MNTKVETHTHTHFAPFCALAFPNATRTRISSPRLLSLRGTLSLLEIDAHREIQLRSHSFYLSSIPRLLGGSLSLAWLAGWLAGCAFAASVRAHRIDSCFDLAGSAACLLACLPCAGYACVCLRSTHQVEAAPLGPSDYFAQLCVCVCLSPSSALLPSCIHPFILPHPNLAQFRSYSHSIACHRFGYLTASLITTFTLSRCYTTIVSHSRTRTASAAHLGSPLRIDSFFLRRPGQSVDRCAIFSLSSHKYRAFSRTSASSRPSCTQVSAHTTTLRLYIRI